MCNLNFSSEKFYFSQIKVLIILCESEFFIIDFLFFSFGNEIFCGLFRQIQKMFLRMERVRLKARKGLRTRLNWSSLTRKKAFVLI